MWKQGRYRLLGPQPLREGPGLQYPRIEEADGLDRFGRLPGRTLVRVREIRSLSVSSWGRLDQGWICLETGETIYAEPERAL
ncbi:hypothetical protein K280104A7_13930 [Candidatus Bariatricus faecipullorum]